MLTAVRLLLLGAASMYALRIARRAPSRERARALQSVRHSRVAAGLDAWVAPILRSAGYDIDARGAAVLWLTAAAALMVMSGAMAPAMIPGAVVIAVAVGPMAVLVGRRGQQRAVLAAVPALLEETAHQLRSGGTVTSALDEIAVAGRSPLAIDCRRALARTQLGLRLRDALALWMAERPLPEVRVAAGALGIAAELGGRSATALDGLARGLRDRAAVAAETAALATQGTLSAVVVGAAPVGYLVLTTAIGGRELHVLTATAAGRLCLTLGLVLEGLAVVWMHRIVTKTR